MPQKPEPQWRDISFLPLITSLINETLKENKVQYQNFIQIKDKPHVLDDETVQRSIKLYTEQLEDHLIFTEQLKRWQKEEITDEQREEIKKLQQQTDELEKVTQKLLDMAREFEPETIDKILAKDDLELAFEVLTGKLKMPI